MREAPPGIRRMRSRQMTNTSAVFADFASNLKCAAIPAPVVERAKLLIADSIGIAIRACHDVPSSAVHLRALRSMGQLGDFPIFGSRSRLSAPAATELNGALIHSLDFDDTYSPGALHPSAAVLPAALAAVQMSGASGADLLAAVVAGYELMCRLSVALGAADHYDRGFHPSATCGAFAAAMAAGRALGLDARQCESALGIALSQTAGSLQFLVNGAWTKRFQVGNAARAGLVSACLAREGYRGAAEPLEGKHGFLQAYASNPQTHEATCELGETWRTLEIAVKPYPSCRFSHAAIDAIVGLKSDYAFAPKDVSRIVCGLSRKGILLVGDPIEHKRQPADVVSAQFSMPFAAAVAVMEEGMGWDSYSRWLGTAELTALMGLVDVEHDSEVEALFPARFGARVQIALRDGRVLNRLVTSPKGESDNFVTRDLIDRKFDDLVAPYVDHGSRQILLNTVFHLDSAETTGAIFAPFVADR